MMCAHPVHVSTLATNGSIAWVLTCQQSRLFTPYASRPMLEWRFNHNNAMAWFHEVKMYACPIKDRGPSLALD
eukprot:6096938-Karenia_brevis.AAC.1